MKDAPVRLSRPEAILACVAALGLALPGAVAIRALEATGLPPVLAIALAAVALLLGLWAHEAAHLAALRLFGVPARLADRVRWLPFFPRSVSFPGSVPAGVYLLDLAAPLAAALLLMALPFPFLRAVGFFTAAGALDDLGRIAYVIRKGRGRRFEQSPDGRRFRPEGEGEWISVNPAGRPGLPPAAVFAVGAVTGLLAFVLSAL